MSQLNFSFGHNAAYDVDSFFVSGANEEAFNFITGYQNFTGDVGVKGGGAVLHNIFMIYGPQGCGKTHLAAIWKGVVNARQIFSDNSHTKNYRQIVPQIIKPRGSYIIEDIESVDEVILLHIINTANEGGARLMMTSTQSPANLAREIPDLASRLKNILHFEIGNPDQELLCTIVAKQLSDRQIIVEDNVINFIIGRIERSFGGACRAVEIIDAIISGQKRKVTIPAVRDLLGISA